MQRITKQILLLTCLFMALFSCDKKTSAYQIEGTLSNLKDSTLFAVFTKNKFKKIDTITCTPDGSFKIETDSLFDYLRILSSEKKRIINVYLDSTKLITIDGDAKYPELAQIKGGKINDKLTEFKNINKALLIERRELHTKLVESKNPNSDNGEVISKLINIKHDIKSAVLEFLQNNRSELVSTVLIQRYFTNREDTRKLDELLGQLDPSLKETSQVKWLEDFSARVKRTAVGSKAPRFKIKDINNKPINIESYKGTTLLLAFAAPWCEVCETEKQYLEDIRKIYPKKKLKMLVVTLSSDQDSIRKIAKKEKFAWDLVADSANYATELVDLYEVKTVPSNFVIDTAGIIQLKSEHLFETKQLLKKYFADKKK